MPETFIAGYDGSEAARAALRFACRLAEAEGGEVVAASVYPHAHPVHRSSPAAEEASREARERSEELLAGSGVPEVAYVTVPAGSVPEGLHNLAVDQHASLIAVGVTHRGPIGRLVPGGVGDRLLHGAPCPVAVVPPGWDADAIETVGVAWHDTETAADALKVAERLALRVGARLVILAVAEPVTSAFVTPGAGYVSTEGQQQIHEEWERRVAELVAGLDPKLRAEGRVLDGPAGPRLAEEAASGIDVLVTGSRGYGPARAVLLGSVSRYLADHAACPVLVVPRGAAD